MDTADILVVGAGPAGCAAAITAAQHGARTVLLEQAAFPRYRPGETLHPGVEPLFAQLGVRQAIDAAGFLRHRGIWHESHGVRHFLAYGSDSHGDWLGWQIPGERLDAILLAQAETLGVQVIQRCRAERFLFEKGRLRGVHTNQGRMVAPVLIDATGHRRLLTRHLGLVHSRDSPPLLAQFGYVRGRCTALQHGPRFERLASGWLWSAHIRDDLLHWTRLFTRRTPLERGYIPAQFGRFRSTATIFCRDVTWRHLPECARTDYFVVGDAAAVLDPSSSHGVLRALMSGIMAAHAISTTTDLAVSACQYRQWLPQWYQADVAHLRQMGFA